MKDIIKNRLNETFSKTEKEEISKIIDSKELEKKIEKIIINKLKNNKELEDKVVDITKDVITKVFKALWIKKNLWTATIK